MFVSADGRAYVEDIKPRYRFIEEFDGFHPLSKDSVFRDVDGLHKPLVIIWHGIPAPEGSRMNSPFQYVFDTLKESVTLELARSRPPMSRILWRRIVGALVWFGRSAYCLGVVIGIVYFGYVAFILARFYL